MTKTYTKEEKKMKIENESFLVVKSSGEKISGKSLKFVSKSSAIKIDDQEIKVKEVTAYQNKTAYFIKFGPPDKFTWVKQLKRGKINLYYYDIISHGSYFNGTKYVTENKTETHFVFRKGDEELLELSITGIAERLKDNKDAYDNFTATFGEKDKKFLPKQLQNHPKVLFRSIDIYNGDL